MALGVFVSESGEYTGEIYEVEVQETRFSVPGVPGVETTKWVLYGLTAAARMRPLAVFDTKADADRQHEDVRRWYALQVDRRLMLAHLPNNAEHWHEETITDLSQDSIYDLREEKIAPHA